MGSRGEERGLNRGEVFGQVGKISEVEREGGFQVRRCEATTLWHGGLRARWVAATRRRGGEASVATVAKVATTAAVVTFHWDDWTLQN